MKTLVKVVGVVLCMAAMARAASVDDLMTQLKDKDAQNRRAAAKGLAEAGPDAKPAVPALIDALKDKDVRTDAAVALGDIGPAAKDAVEPLRDAVSDKKKVKKDKPFKQAVNEAIKKINAK